MFEIRKIPMRRLDRSHEHDIHFVLSDADLAELAAANDWRRAEIAPVAGRLSPRDDGWEIRLDLSGRVTQNCVISGAPVSSDVDRSIRRVYLFDMPEPDGDLTLPTDFDDDEEAMPVSLDLIDVICEVLILELPEYPKLAKYLDSDTFMHLDPDDLQSEGDDKPNPFAALSALKTGGTAE